MQRHFGHKVDAFCREVVPQSFPDNQQVLVQEVLLVVVFKHAKVCELRRVDVERVINFEVDAIYDLGSFVVGVSPQFLPAL